MSSNLLSGYFDKQGWPAPSGEDRSSVVAQIEQRYGVQLPEDFREYLLTLCPAEDEWDDESGIWWGLGSIKSLSEEYQHKVGIPEVDARAGQYLLFADFCIWFWGWAIACTDDENRGKVVLLEGARNRFIAPSFTAFANAYVTDWPSVNAR